MAYIKTNLKSNGNKYNSERGVKKKERERKKWL
jgi:hypothetical protein